MSTTLSIPPDADDPPPLPLPLLPEAQAEAVTVKLQPVVDDASSCSTASLRQYYDDCAEYYDQADEGTENTYICVDRVTSALLGAMHRLFSHAHADGADAADEAAIPPRHTSATPPILKRPELDLHDSVFVKPTPLPNLAALTLLAGAGGPPDDTPILSVSTPSPFPIHSPVVDGEGEGDAATAPVCQQDADSDSASSVSVPSTPALTDLEAEAEASTTASESPRSSSSASVSPLSQSPSATFSVLSSVSASSAASSSSCSFSPSSRLTVPQSLHLSSPSPLRILDLGVGTGLASRPLFSALSVPSLPVPRSSSVGERMVSVPPGTLLPEIWGVDLSPGMLRVSSVLPFAKLVAADLNTPLRDTELHPDSPLARLDSAEYFDMVLCVGTTEFVRDYPAFLRQVHGFLRAGGLFAGTFPYTRSQTYPDMFHIAREDLIQVASRAGLDVLGVEQYRGWSVSAEEHVEYTQILCQKKEKGGGGAVGEGETEGEHQHQRQPA